MIHLTKKTKKILLHLPTPSAVNNCWIKKYKWVFLTKKVSKLHLNDSSSSSSLRYVQNAGCTMCISSQDWPSPGLMQHSAVLWHDFLQALGQGWHKHICFPRRGEQERARAWLRAPAPPLHRGACDCHVTYDAAEASIFIWPPEECERTENSACMCPVNTWR